jgi:hypothetical protein
MRRKGFGLSFRLMALRVCVLASGMAAAPVVAQAPSDAARFELKGYIENVVQATARRYGARDSAGNTMDSARIVGDPAGGYLAVYHTYVGGVPYAKLATSTDLLNWTYRRDLGSHASQPTLKLASNGGVVVAWEQEPGNHIAIRYYASRADLLNGVVARTYDTARTLSTCAEGTPNIYSITLSPDIAHSTIDIGGHYLWNCDRDRQQRGALKNFATWTTSAQANVDNALLYWGVQGNIGARDGYSNFRGYDFGVIEGQLAKGDFGSWRSFLYDYQTGNADQLNLHTNGGSTAFANPTSIQLMMSGRWASVTTLFIPSEGAAPGEAGELIYYRIYGSAPTAPPAKTEATRAIPTSGGPAATATRAATPTVPNAPVWQPGVWYVESTVVGYGGAAYKCTQPHTSQVGWEPPNTPALWAKQ